MSLALAASSLTTLALATSAHAQSDGIGTLRSGGNAGGVGGVRVSDTSYLRLRVLAEAGYDSNVFFNDQQKVDSPTLLVTPSAQLTNDGGSSQPPPVRYSLGATLIYREYLSDDESTKAQRSFNPTFNGLLGYSASPSFSVVLSDHFSRLEDPPYVPGTGTIQRLYNNAVLDLRLTPGGGRLQNSFRYSNGLEIFESDAASYANRMSHDFMLGASWKWLPKTAVFVEGGLGYVQYLDADLARAQGKVDSVPYRLLLGIRGLVTPKLTANLAAGYADAIYDSDAADPSGMSNLATYVTLTHSFSRTSNLSVGYQHRFVDSPFVGNFFDSDAAIVALNQQVAAFVLRGFYSYEFRRYKGFQAATPVSRRDHLQTAGVQADYYLQRWFFAGVGYAAQVNRTNLGVGSLGAQGTSADYTKHVILGRLGIAY